MRLSNSLTLCFGVLVALLGCGDDAKKASPSSPAPTATPQDLEACTEICARIEETECASQPPGCSATCRTSVRETPSRCLTKLRAFEKCATSSRADWACDALDEAQPAGCLEEFEAWAICQQQSPEPDAGTKPSRDAASDQDASPPGSGDGLSCKVEASDDTCDECVKERCCEAYASCGASCQRGLACIGECAPGNEACADGCTKEAPAGASTLYDLRTCMRDACAEACGSAAPFAGARQR